MCVCVCVCITLFSLSIDLFFINSDATVPLSIYLSICEKKEGKGMGGIGRRGEVRGRKEEEGRKSEGN